MLIFVLVLFVTTTRAEQQQSTTTSCDLDKYKRYLASTEGKDIFVVSSLCESAVEMLKTRLAGFHGPVLQEDMEAIMCTDECIMNDLLHLEAMSTTGCNCAELSSKSHVEADFCKQNSARFLCHHLGVCGKWDCKLTDYMCPRHEWNRLYTCGQMKLVPTWLLIIAAAVWINLV